MQKLKTSLFYLVLFSLASVHPLTAQTKSLEEIYRTGIVRFVPEITIDDSSLPEDYVFVGFGSLAVDREGNVYYLDVQANNIKKFDASGTFLKVIGRQGLGPGEFQSPMRFTCSRDRIFVWDMMNMRISLLTLDGEFIKSVRHSFNKEGHVMRLRALPDGNILIELEKRYRDPKKPQDNSIELYSPEMEHIKTIYIQPVWRYIMGIPDLPSIPQPFSPLVYWNTSPKGRIALGFSKEYKIEVFDASEGFLFDFTHSYEPIEVTQKDKDAYSRNILSATTTGRGTLRRKEPSPAMKKYRKFPDYKPAFNRIVIDSEENILVSTYREKSNENYKYFDAFDPEGNYISTVQINSSLSFLALYEAPFSDRCFWVRHSDKEGYTKLVKYRIFSKEGGEHEKSFGSFHRHLSDFFACFISDNY